MGGTYADGRYQRWGQKKHFSENVFFGTRKSSQHIVSAMPSPRARDSSGATARKRSSSAPPSPREVIVLSDDEASPSFYNPSREEFRRLIQNRQAELESASNVDTDSVDRLRAAAMASQQTQLTADDFQRFDRYTAVPSRAVCKATASRLLADSARTSARCWYGRERATDETERSSKGSATGPGTKAFRENCRLVCHEGG